MWLLIHFSRALQNCLASLGNQWQTACLPACISVNVRPYCGGNLSRKIECHRCNLHFFDMNEVQSFFRMFVGYLNFFSSKMSIHAISPLYRLGFIFLFIYKSSLHIKNINPFWQTLSQTLWGKCCQCFLQFVFGLLILCMVLFLTHVLLARSISIFLFGFWHRLDAQKILSHCKSWSTFACI